MAERTSSIHTMQATRQSDGPPQMSKQEKQLTSMDEEELERVLKERLGDEGLAWLRLVMSAENTCSTTCTPDTKESKITDTKQVGASSAGDGKAEVEGKKTEAEEV